VVGCASLADKYWERIFFLFSFCPLFLFEFVARAVVQRGGGSTVELENRLLTVLKA
jgi:hypothetical protein